MQRKLTGKVTEHTKENTKYGLALCSWVQYNTTVCCFDGKQIITAFVLRRLFWTDASFFERIFCVYE